MEYTKWAEADGRMRKAIALAKALHRLRVEGLERISDDDMSHLLMDPVISELSGWPRYVDSRGRVWPHKDGGSI